ncbi:OTU-like cysteine protease-domain-containing protein [Melampsora americana]|nr:OTU-like cysteine protease-domain-containing protein [Melampsora americana]
MLLKLLWVPTLVLMPKSAIAALLNHIDQLTDVGRVGSNVFTNEAKTSGPQVTSHIFSPSDFQKVTLRTTSSHEVGVSTEGTGVRNAFKIDDGSPIRIGAPHDPESPSPGLHWRFASKADYQKANKELLELKSLDQSIWGSTAIQNAPKFRPDGLTDFSITKVIPGDGNCQFRAISLMMTGSQESHETIRKAAVGYMELNFRKFKDFADLTDPKTGGTWEGYLKNLKKPGTYGDHLTLNAMAEIFRRKFVVLSERSTHDGVDIIKGQPDGTSKTYSLYLNNNHYEILLKDLSPPNKPFLNNLRESDSFPPSNYRLDQPIRSASSSTFESSDSGRFHGNRFQDNSRYQTYTMEPPKSQTYKVASYIARPSGEVLPENSKTPPPFSQTRTMPDGRLSSQDRNLPGYYKNNPLKADFGKGVKNTETRPVDSPSKAFKADTGATKAGLRLRLGTANHEVINGFAKNGLKIDPAQASKLLNENYQFDSRIPKELSKWQSIQYAPLGKTLYKPPFESKGASQFQTFSVLIGQEGKHGELRSQAIQTMKAQRRQYEPSIDAGLHGSWEQYLAYMEKPDTPGDHLTLQALADTFGRRVVVVNQRPGEPKVMLQEMAPLKPDANQDGSLLMYQNNQHWVLLN